MLEVFTRKYSRKEALKKKIGFMWFLISFWTITNWLWNIDDHVANNVTGLLRDYTYSFR